MALLHHEKVTEMETLLQRVNLNVGKQRTKMKECIHAVQVVRAEWPVWSLEHDMVWTV
jgi:hypothetical protein